MKRGQVWFWLIMVASCTNKPNVECGEGTVLKEGKCVVATHPRSQQPAQPAPAAPTKTVAASPAVAPDAMPSNAQAGSQEPAEPAAKWMYKSATDPMRGTTTNVARLMSENTTKFDFPYGDARLDMYLRQSGSRQELFLVIVKGQFRCSYDGCRVRVKFDDGKVQSFYAQEGDSADSLFISNLKGWVSQLKTAKRAIVEADFYQEGARQFTFVPTGLTWPPKRDDQKSPSKTK